MTLSLLDLQTRTDETNHRSESVYTFPQMPPVLKRHRNRREVPAEIADERFISADEWAVTCGVTKRQVFRWISAGSVPPADFSLGQVRRWRLSTLKSWLETRVAS